MFFIGIFGIEEKAKVIRQIDVEICPFCTRKGSYTLFKVYNYLHFFFIPVLRWNTRYFIQTSCCSKVYLITNPQLAHDLEHGKDVPITLADVELFRNLQGMYQEGIDSDFCPNCGNRVLKNFLYCPYCGQKLE
ncbi:zinc-ribbon domain-containing protein [Caldicellulosiruptor changbaiensis]|uniref:Zinc-ribbon domain-containing protein n=1 Tax=Caldicellulosiruptor changbaiensis TaxID=1222016 RepID=A0A3T0D3R0_9FIRM|nr:zinc ribbon domain-containing protein [Caldicellulosiruptor changbaiensis]AZT89283.1 zinc-ribbon domain-containing protein [Caldicellulosiruptor changbaiensis]